MNISFTANNREPENISFEDMVRTSGVYEVETIYRPDLRFVSLGCFGRFLIVGPGSHVLVYDNEHNNGYSECKFRKSESVVTFKN